MLASVLQPRSFYHSIPILSVSFLSFLFFLSFSFILPSFLLLHLPFSFIVFICFAFLIHLFIFHASLFTSPFIVDVRFDRYSTFNHHSFFFLFFLFDSSHHFITNNTWSSLSISLATNRTTPFPFYSFILPHTSYPSTHHQP